MAAARAGADEGLLVLADLQTRGRGRAGRRWEAPSGSALMFSLLAYPRDRDPSLALVVGLAVADALEEVGAPAVRLKWPNDCLAAGRKVAGILVEGCGTGGDRPAVAVGVGCNVSWRGIPPGGRPGPPATALDLLGVRVGRLDLALLILSALESRRRSWEASGFSGMRAEWELRAAWMGEPVVVSLPGREVRGVMSGIDEVGALLVTAPEGEVHVAAGDLSSRAGLRPAVDPAGSGDPR